MRYVGTKGRSAGGGLGKCRKARGGSAYSIYLQLDLLTKYTNLAQILPTSDRS